MDLRVFSPDFKIESVVLRRVNAFASLQHAVDTRRLRYSALQIRHLHTAAVIMLANSAGNMLALDTSNATIRVFSNSQSLFLTLQAELHEFLILSSKIILEFLIHNLPATRTIHFKHLLHSHRVFIARSLVNVPSHGIFFHFPSTLIRMTLLAMYTGVYMPYLVIC